jgi:hypothetical protein
MYLDAPMYIYGASRGARQISPGRRQPLPAEQQPLDATQAQAQARHSCAQPLILGLCQQRFQAMDCHPPCQIRR